MGWFADLTMGHIIEVCRRYLHEKLAARCRV